MVPVRLKTLFKHCIQAGVIASAFLSCLHTQAQTDGLGSWNIVNFKYNVNSKWSLFGEAQLRSLLFYNNFHYHEYKGGGTYILSKNFSITAGVGRYSTYREGGNFRTPMANDELRTWLQVNMTNALGDVQFEHRYRAEQRFTSANGYRNRFRYRLAVAAPIARKNNDKIYFSIWNELFLTNEAPYFERNRFFAGIGYEFSQNFTWQVGYVNQLDYRINDETGRNFLQTSWLFTFPWKQRKSLLQYLPQ
jgi:hypothetical protein